MSLRVFHCADLHLSRAERSYGLEVLADLVHHCRLTEADAWVLSGDVFDTPADADALAEDVVSHLADLGDLPVVMIPGNHELAGGASPDSLKPLAAKLAPALTLVLEEPFGLVLPDHPELELLGVPFRRTYEDFPDWRPPAKTRPWRVGLLHGVVNGLTFSGESEEEEHGVIDPHLFARLALDYAALGHIHAGREARQGSCLAHYPGSARVWRRGESGPRSAALVILDDGGVHTEIVTLEAAGQYVARSIPLDEDGMPVEHDSAEALLEAVSEGRSAQDWLRLELTGFTESITPVEELQRKLQRLGEGQFRRFEVVHQVVEAEGLRGHPLVRAFNAAWNPRFAQARAAGDESEMELLSLARRQALEEIHKRLTGS